MLFPGAAAGQSSPAWTESLVLAFVGALGGGEMGPREHCCACGTAIGVSLAFRGAFPVEMTGN